MTTDATIVQRLEADAAVAAIIAARIYNGSVPSDAVYPFLQFQVAGGQMLSHLDGVESLRNPEYQFDCYAATMGEAQRLALAAIVALASNPDGDFGAVVNSHPFSNRSEDTKAYRLTFLASVWSAEAA